VPGFDEPFASPQGFYLLILAVAAFVTWLSWNIARMMWGRALVAIRDSEVTAASVGVRIYRAKLRAFVFSGVSAGIAGALFASLQSYITPDTFVFELGLFFFVCIIIGGRGAILGPFFGTVVLTALPELVAPLAKLGVFFYGLLLLVVVLLVPEGIGRVVELTVERLRPRPPRRHGVAPELDRLAAAIRANAET
jgi:branched-chain amino acid transport system permease protein